MEMDKIECAIVENIKSASTRKLRDNFLLCRKTGLYVKIVFRSFISSFPSFTHNNISFIDKYPNFSSYN